MSIFDRLTNVAKGKAILWTRGPAAPADDAVEAELAELRPAPQERELAPATQAPRRPVAPVRDPAEHPVARTDLLGDDDQATTATSPKRDLL